jgi:hypothetical protein
MAKGSKERNPFMGRWRIVSMEQWDQDYVDEEEEGYFEFTDKGGASSTSATPTARWTAA